MSSTPRRPATEAETAALASTVRLRIIRMTRVESLTNAQIAKLLGRDPATTLHHVRKLVKHGFLVPQEPRRGVRGAKEIPYRATDLSWQLDGGARDTPALAEAMLRAYLDEVARLGATDLRQTRLVVRLDPDDVSALYRELDDLLQRWSTRPSAPDGTDVAIYLSVYPGGNRPDAGGVDVGA